jgi:hypothetical protein
MNKKLFAAILVLLTVVCCTQDPMVTDPDEEEVVELNESIPFEFWTNFERYELASPLFTASLPEWAAAAHAIVVEDSIHYYYSIKDVNNYWELYHAYAPVENPEEVTYDPRNPILENPATGMDSKSIEYPNPIYNPYDDKYYMYYLVKEAGGGYKPKQTGLLVCNSGDLGEWERVVNEPIIVPEYTYENLCAAHTGVAVVGDTIHIVYTAYESWSNYQPKMCHAWALTSDPKTVTKNPNNPVFTGGGGDWESLGVREAELFKGPHYFHIFYGGRNNTDGYQIGHVRTKDFVTFEPNPYNPIFTTPNNPDAWDADELLTPQVLKIGDDYFMLYAGAKYMIGGERLYQSGLARIPK